MIDKHEMRWWALSKIGRALMMIRPETIIALLDEFEQLHAQIETMRKQKPAAYLYEYVSPIDGTTPVWRNTCETWNGQQARSTRPLYIAPSVPDEWQPIETAPKDGTHVLLANKTGTRVADGMYGNYKVWSWPYVLVEPAYWRPMPAAPGAQENNDGRN